jgi:hypothetical protein
MGGRTSNILEVGGGVGKATPGVNVDGAAVVVVPLPEAGTVVTAGAGVVVVVS